MKKNFHSIIMLISLTALCMALHHTLHTETASAEDQAINEKKTEPPASQTFPSAFFIGLD
ncbi:hypothetical protein [Agriterribacter sp.]|uniref:hypothetical protein n=1 Tax=Agriterribacter sp. TaxID=2821509 RepID=UPI002C45499F|nr:hypothetical protein [Agriterribacter sp.]HTN06784.1 hypothetical protein [Agriterribacter sp.]